MEQQRQSTAGRHRGAVARGAAGESARRIQLNAMTAGDHPRVRAQWKTEPGPTDRRYGEWTAVCLAVLLGLATADLLLEESVAGTLAVPPLMASALAPRRETVVVGVASVSGAVLVSAVDDAALAAALVRIGAVVLAAAVAAWVATLRTAREQRLAHLTRVAEIAQNAILLPVPSRTECVSLAARYRSATSDASVGGDLLDVIEADTFTFAIVGDVRGKGLTAVRLAATALRAVRDAALTAPDLEAAVGLIERRLARDLDEEDFITAVILRIDRAGRVELVNCAHPPPLLIRGDSVRPVEPQEPSMPFGLGPQPTTTRLQLQPGDRLFLYTDGLIEARAVDSRQHVPLAHVTPGLAELPLEVALDDVLQRLRTAAAGRLADDLALLLVEYAPQGPSPLRSLQVDSERN